jgi:hypothetical protein
MCPAGIVIVPCPPAFPNSYASTSAHDSEIGAIDEVEVFDLRCSVLEWSWDLFSRREPFERSDASETTLRILRKTASGATEANTSQIDGKLAAIRDTPISNV